MNVKTILIFLAGIVGTILLAGGAYISFSNLIKPEGYLFEGVVLMSLGFILDMVILVATTIGQTIIMFSDVLKKQTELYEEVRKQREEQIKPRGGLGEIISELMKNSGGTGSISIQDLDDPDGNPKIIPLGDIEGKDSIHDFFSKSIKKSKGKHDLSDLTIKELEEKLSVAVTEDKFEEAEEIKKEIQSRKSSSDGESEKKGD